jgi:hypothetical protein
MPGIANIIAYAVKKAFAFLFIAAVRLVVITPALAIPVFVVTAALVGCTLVSIIRRLPALVIA